MRKPPVFSRAGGRRVSGLKGAGAAHLLPKTRLGGPMPWVIAIMVALTVLATGGALALGNMVERARGELDGALTVQIIEADAGGRAAQAERAASVLRSRDDVAAVHVVPQAELEELVEPWLGESADGEVVPIPALIDVQLSGPADRQAIAELETALRAAAPDARINAQSDWLGPVFGTVSALRWLALSLIALLAFAAASAVWLAARNALNANRGTMEVVHLLGGDDRQIAGIFQRSVLLDALLGGFLGLALGALAISFLGAQFAALESGMASGAALGVADWALIACIPLAAVALALFTARMTVMRSLGKML